MGILSIDIEWIKWVSAPWAIHAMCLMVGDKREPCLPHIVKQSTSSSTHDANWPVTTASCSVIKCLTESACLLILGYMASQQRILADYKFK